jgi:2'-5' RNA ligase
MTKRLFIGVPVSSIKAVQKVESWKSNSRMRLNKLNWVKPENWHITLCFLGDTPDEKVGALKQMIDQAFNEVAAFNSKLEGVGVFPNRRDPNVLWLGLNGLQTIIPAHQKLGDLLRQNDFSFDQKSLKPHLTIARMKFLADKTIIDTLVNDYGQTVFDTMNVNRVVLFESLLTPQGPIYKALYTKEFLSAEGSSFFDTI